MRRKWKCIAITAVLCFTNLNAAMLSAQRQNDEALLRTRETVWRAWFAGDTKTLERLVPPQTIVMSGGEKEWKTQSDVLRSSAEFHSKGGKLIRLEFPVLRCSILVTWLSFGAAILWKRKSRANDLQAQAA